MREQNADLMAASALGLWYMEQDFGETAEVLFPCYGGSFSYIAATVTLRVSVMCKGLHLSHCQSGLVLHNPSHTDA